MSKNDEIKFEELLPWQQEVATVILNEDKYTIMNRGRRSGKTFVRKYIIQELKKRDS